MASTTFFCKVMQNPCVGPTIGLGTDVLVCSQLRKLEFHSQKKPMRAWRSFSGLDLVSHQTVLFECCVCLPIESLGKSCSPGRFAGISHKSEAGQREIGGGQECKCHPQWSCSLKLD